jgi:hypothetical protein
MPNNNTNAAECNAIYFSSFWFLFILLFTYSEFLFFVFCLFCFTLRTGVLMLLHAYFNFVLSVFFFVYVSSSGFYYTKLALEPLNDVLKRHLPGQWY